MAAASAGLLFLNGIGAIAGPLIIGFMMETIGPVGFSYLSPFCWGSWALWGLPYDTASCHRRGRHVKLYTRCANGFARLG